MFIQPTPWTIRSDKDVHFTGAIIQNASEVETIAGLPGNTVRINRVTILSDENLAWDLEFLRSTAISPGDMDTDLMVEWVSFLASDAMRNAAAGPYRYTWTGLDIPYTVATAGGLIMALINRSVAAKTAAAAGEVVVEIEGVTA